MESLLFPAVLVLILGVLHANGACPDNPSQAIQNCAERIQIDLNVAEGHKFITDGEYTKKMCEGEEVKESVKCMKTIHADCLKKGVKEEEMLMKPESWESAMKAICDNRQFLTKNADCVMKGATNMTACVSNFTKQAVVKSKLTTIDSAVKNKGEKEKLKIICGLSKDLMACFDKTLVKNCPKKMEKILDDILYRLLPPICHPGTKDTSYDHLDDGPDPNSAVRLSALTTLSVAVAMCLRSVI